MELQYGAYVPVRCIERRGQMEDGTRGGDHTRRHRGPGHGVDGCGRGRAQVRSVDVASRWRSPPRRGATAASPRSLAAANHTVSVARGDNLDTGSVPSLIATLTASGTRCHDHDHGHQVARGGPCSPQRSDQPRRAGGERVACARRACDAGHHTQGRQRERVRDAVQLAAANFHAAGTSAHLKSVASRSCRSRAFGERGADGNRLRPRVPNGKVIDIDVSTQSAVFFDDGCIAGSTLVTTGRPGLRTPTGTFHIYAKYSPITLISPWPTSSPYYYTPEKATYAMEFLGGGFFIHDAPWEPTSDVRPGSQNGVDASHGCVHIPTPPWPGSTRGARSGPRSSSTPEQRSGGARLGAHGRGPVLAGLEVRIDLRHGERVADVRWVVLAAKTTPMICPASFTIGSARVAGDDPRRKHLELAGHRACRRRCCSRRATSVPLTAAETICSAPPPG